MCERYNILMGDLGDRKLWPHPSYSSSNKLRSTMTEHSYLDYKLDVNNRLITSLFRLHKTSSLKKLPLHK